MKNKITIAIPAHNNEKVIAETIKSAMDQEYPLKEILVIDDFSTDKTAEIAESMGVRVIRNGYNFGIGRNLEKLMTECKTKYIMYLCSDDLFANTKVLKDIVYIFDNNKDIGVVGRFYYHFMDGHKGAISNCRDKNILTQSCCPSGMAFRTMDIQGTNKIFIEMPYIVSQYLKKYRWTMLEYDVIAARFHPGGNTGTKSSYYVESPTQNWIDLLGQNYRDFPIFIQLKNRAPHLLWSEIWLHVKSDTSVLLESKFWMYSLVAILLPRSLLSHLTKFYRHRMTRKSAIIIERPADV